MIHEFPPGKQTGIAFHLSLLFLFTAGFLASVYWLAIGATSLIIPFLIITVLSCGGAISFLGFRFFGLAKATYLVDRDILTIEWGYRREMIPLSDIDWIKHISSLNEPVASPRFYLPGGNLGEVQDTQLGLVEYVASDRDNLVFVGTAKKVFAISPADPAGFMEAFARIFEMGSLDQSGGGSHKLNFVMIDAWSEVSNRYLWLANILLNLVFFIAVYFIVPAFSTLRLVPSLNVMAEDPVPSQQLFLLPSISTVVSVLAFMFGIMAYQSAGQKFLAKMVWSSNLITTILMFISIAFILQTGK